MHTHHWRSDDTNLRSLNNDATDVVGLFRADALRQAVAADCVLGVVPTLQGDFTAASAHTRAGAAVSWNYRVLKTADKDGTEMWGVHEVYYNEDGSVKSWTADDVGPHGESCDELHRDHAAFAKAFTVPPLDVTSGKAVELTITGRPKRSRTREKGL
jgi:hypothetical protein